MAYYVSAERNGKRVLAIGPFRNHGDALVRVTSVKRWAQRNVRDVNHFDTAWGTARHRGAHPPGKLNDGYGVRLDRNGYVRSTAEH